MARRRTPAGRLGRSPRPPRDISSGGFLAGCNGARGGTAGTVRPGMPARPGSPDGPVVRAGDLLLLRPADGATAPSLHHRLVRADGRAGADARQGPPIPAGAGV